MILASTRRKNNQESRKSTFHDFDLDPEKTEIRKSRKLTFHDFDIDPKKKEEKEKSQIDC